MSDLAYRLIVDMSTKGSLAPQLGKLETQAKGIDATFKGIGGSLTSGLSGAVGAIEKLGDKVVGVAKSVAMIGAGAAGAGLAYGVTHLNNELEKTKISLAAIFSAQGVTSNMTDGLDMAVGVMEKMRVHARSLPGELHDLQTFFKLGITPGLHLGASVDQIEKISAFGMAAAASTGVQMEVAAREFAQLLQGRAGAHNVFGSLIGFSGEDAQKLNAATGDQRLKMIETALQKYEGSIETFGGSFEALSSTLIDNGKQLLSKATRPVFERVKEQMSVANKWFDDHEYQVGQFAEKVGIKLEHAFDVGRRKIYEWGPPLKSFAEHAAQSLEHIWSRAKPLVEGMEKLAKGAAQSPATFKALEAGALAYGGIKLGGALAPIITGIGGLAGAGGMEAGALGIFGAALPEIAIGAAAAIPLVIGAGGAMHALADETSYYHEEVERSWAGMMSSLQKSTENLGSAWAKTEPYFTRIADGLGAVFVAKLDTYATALEVITSGIESMGEVAAKWAPFLGLDPETAKPGDLKRLLARREDEFQSRRWHPEEERKTKTGAGGGHGGTTIHRVEIVVSSNQDPSRIARMVEDRLTDRARYPTSSRSLPPRKV